MNLFERPRSKQLVKGMDGKRQALSGLRPSWRLPWYEEHGGWTNGSSNGRVARIYGNVPLDTASGWQNT